MNVEFPRRNRTRHTFGTVRLLLCGKSVVLLFGAVLPTIVSAQEVLFFPLEPSGSIAGPNDAGIDLRSATRDQAPFAFNGSVNEMHVRYVE